MTEVIIVVTGTTISVSYDAPRESDKLIFTGDGFCFFMRKECHSIAGRWDAIRHQVMIVAQAHHVPQVSLRDMTARDYKRKKSKASRLADEKTRRLL